jgi:hypothetical protein
MQKNTVYGILDVETSGWWPVEGKTVAEEFYSS